MEEVIKLLANVVNNLHDLFVMLTKRFGLALTDKELHFWLMGILGIGIFFVVHLLFKRMSRWSITSISFIYTFTVMVVIVFAIEIQQKITNRGNMEFEDAIAGLWGFIVLFLIYVAVTLTNYLFKRMKQKNHEDKYKL
ncbi:hypothetical protein BFG57_09145 [Bacillus solimangrovi]|uniref:Uncharacterized protein n=1 Tax=Bacillus solimangrovi TaxID=1305675 RepID=A0A1E5LJD8_9BACI|nr:hypothetical protein [Bacillus solimangrovi]OEH94207.1 hypothetical protein BFG57_09145 [Bacillus solimangrovi]